MKVFQCKRKKIWKDSWQQQNVEHENNLRFIDAWCRWDSDDALASGAGGKKRVASLNSQIQRSWANVVKIDFPFRDFPCEVFWSFTTRRTLSLQNAQLHKLFRLLLLFSAFYYASDFELVFVAPINYTVQTLLRLTLAWWSLLCTFGIKLDANFANRSLCKLKCNLINFALMSSQIKTTFISYSRELIRKIVIAHVVARISN